MEFRLVDTHDFWWPVTVRIPDPERPGQMTEQAFEVRFSIPGKGRVRDLIESGGDDDALLRTAVTGWRGVVDDDGVPLPFSDAALGRLLDMSWARAGLWTALAAASNGVAATKN